jgi:methionine-S-sulfoxide reductase
MQRTALFSLLTALGSALATTGCHSVRSMSDTAEPAPAHTASAPPLTASAVAHVGGDPGHVGYGTPLTPTGNDQLAAFSGGCFWGVEDAFRHVHGVVATAVGFTGGHTNDPTYEKVCTHTTGHAETVLVEYDPTRVPYEQLLRVFFKIHDATEVDRQGPDVGDQYRSAIFTFSPDQEAAARAAKDAEAKALGQRVATDIRPIGPFYKAEDYHQQYAERTGHHGCPIRANLDTL